MIADTFNRRTIANMEVALERACLVLPACSEKHRARRIIASKIIECANHGDTTLGRLTEAGYAAAMQFSCFRCSPSERNSTHLANRLISSADTTGHPRNRGWWDKR
jgi:hypothetical protein